jgi:uncharacterized protein (DUF924 family)
MTQAPAATAAEVIAFWREAGPQRWFRKDEAFDQSCRAVLQQAHEAAVRGELMHWLDSAEGALALVLLLDQVPRNAFRDTARVYASDADAREVADQALRRGFDQQVDAALSRFFYLPFMHSESLEDQERSVALNLPLGDEAARYAVHHRDIVRRFGRFPHRNALLGRTSTPEEQEFLGEGGFAG